MPGFYDRDGSVTFKDGEYVAVFNYSTSRRETAQLIHQLENGRCIIRYVSTNIVRIVDKSEVDKLYKLNY